MSDDKKVDKQIPVKENLINNYLPVNNGKQTSRTRIIRNFVPAILYFTAYSFQIVRWIIRQKITLSSNVVIFKILNINNSKKMNPLVTYLTTT